MCSETSCVESCFFHVHVGLSPQPVAVSTPPPPPPPPMPSSPSVVTQDQTVPISGFRNVMVKTMTASGQVTIT